MIHSISGLNIHELSYKGLKKNEIKGKQEQYGLNELPDTESKSLLQLFIAQFRSPLVYFLLVVSVITFVLKDYADTIIILVVVFINSLFGLFQEYRAQSSIKALKDLVSPKAKVIRDEALQTILAKDIVPGDLVLLEGGDRVPADGKLIFYKNLQVNEAQLTGESFPVSKDSKDDLRVFMGTFVVSGRGAYKVNRIGTKTELGKIATEVGNSLNDKKSPLYLKYSALTNKIILFVTVSCILAFFIGLIRQISFQEMFKVAVSLGVSAIPEGLPVLLTFTLAVGAFRMSKQHAVLRNLPSTSTLAGTDIICTDKTGTITEGRIELIETKTFDQNISQDEILRYASLCNDAIWQKNGFSGDQLDVSILMSHERFNFDKKSLQNYSRIDEIPFDSETKYHATLHSSLSDVNNFILVKGATDVLLPLTTLKSSGKEYKKIIAEIEEYMVNGYRVIALCKKETSLSKLETKELNNLEFLGLLVFLDPLREGIPEVVERCTLSGVKVIMITGDHLSTASTIARKAGILKDKYGLALEGSEFRKLDFFKDKNKILSIRVIARATPHDKSQLIDFYKSIGKTVAMTGDGVNDAPALSKSDIGIAMGVNGTDAAREASDMVLMDDNFGTIVKGISEARIIFDNLRQVISQLLVTNFAEILLIIMAMIVGLPLPLIAVQILWLNLVTDGFINFFIGSDSAKHGDVMQNPVRRYKREFIDRILLYRIMIVSPLISIGTLYVFYSFYTMTGDLIYSQTVALITLSMYQWINSLNSRSEDKTLAEIGMFKNSALNASLLGVFALMLFSIYTPFMNQALSTVPVGIEVWGIALLATVPLLVVEHYRKKLITYFFHDY